MIERGKQPRLASAYDVVVVGAGNGGLGAALTLAKKGARPLLLEQHNAPGGFATSFVRGRFEFEASLHELAGIGPPERKGGVRAFLEDECGVEIEWVPIPEAYRVILPDQGVSVRLPFGVEAFIDAVAQEVPEGRKPLERYMELCRDIAKSLGILASAQNPAKILKLVARKARASGRPVRETAGIVTGLDNLLRTLPYSVDEVADKFKLPQRVKDIISPWWCYLGIPMSRLSFTLWAAMLIDYLEYGAWIPKLRSQEMTSAIEARIRELGGRVEYNTRVERIMVEDGRVTGIRTSAGDEIRAGQVICNASPTLAYNKLVYPASETPEAALRNVNSRALGPAGFVVYLGLDAAVDELGIEEYGYFISNTMDTDRVYDSMSRLGLTDMQAVTCQNVPIPDCSPPGTTILSLTTLYKPEVWEEVRPEDYFRTKNLIASRMIAQFEEGTGIRIRDRIEEIEVATPATFARYAGVYKGGIYGYEPDPWDCIIPRVLADRQERYIKGLRFAGGFGTFCHGYSSALVSGRFAALDLLAELGGAL